MSVAAAKRFAEVTNAETSLDTRRTVMTSLADEALMDEIRVGRADALTILFERYSRLVFGIVTRILRDRGEAEDLTQEVFLEIYLKAKLYNPGKGSVKIWLLQYAYHRSFNRRKYLALRGFYSASPTLIRPAAELCGAMKEGGSLDSIDCREILQKGMKRLNDRERQIIELVVLHGWTLREVSVHLQQSYANSRNIYYRGIRKLRETAVNRLSQSPIKTALVPSRGRSRAPEFSSDPSFPVTCKKPIPPRKCALSPTDVSVSSSANAAGTNI
jgi:RNA polymerase sigma-70 factor, ECF subfamily